MSLSLCVCVGVCGTIRFHSKYNDRAGLIFVNKIDSYWTKQEYQSPKRPVAKTASPNCPCRRIICRRNVPVAESSVAESLVAKTSCRRIGGRRNVLSPKRHRRNALDRPSRAESWQALVKLTLSPSTNTFDSKGGRQKLAPETF